MPYKNVCLPIRVPQGDYCWDSIDICDHFDNYGGYPSCTLKCDDLKYNKEGHVEKPSVCKNLKGI